MSPKAQRYFNKPFTVADAQRQMDNITDTANGQSPMNGKEMRVLEYLAAMDSKIIESGDVMRERLKAVPNGWRQWRLMASTLNRLLKDLYRVTPLKNLRHLQNICQYGEVLIRMRPATRVPEFSLVCEDDLMLVVNTVLASECSLCMREGKEINRCQLRKALWNIAPLMEELPTSCGYWRIAIERNTETEE